MLTSRYVSFFLPLTVLAACSGGGSGGAGIGAPIPSSSAPSSSAPSSPAPSSPAPSSGPTASSSTGAPASQPLSMGSFSALIYNVAGLPQGISKSDPAVNTEQISALLNSYDLVLVQEDFFYHHDLERNAQHPHQSQPQTGYFPRLTNDGLNRFARAPFTDFDRQTWDKCYGIIQHDNDCLGNKGFSFARHQLAPGVEVDIYNLHADAGGDPGDIDARRDQLRQLAEYIDKNSKGRAVIVAGDTNSRVRRSEDEQTLATFMAATNTEIADRVLGVFPDEIDRYLFRSGDKVDLEPLSRRVASEFVDSQGQDLSDHLAINIEFLWQLWP